MKTILFLLIFNVLEGFCNPALMRKNFGANNPLFRVSFSKFSAPDLLPPCKYGILGNSESGMLKNTRLSAEAMAMFNNNHNAPGEMNRPRFLHMKISYDDGRRQTLYTFSYAQSTTCLTKLKGFWTLGLGLNTQTKYKDTIEEKASGMAFRIGFNGYTKNVGVVGEMYWVNKAPLFNVNFYQKIKENFLVNIGIVNNLPKVGIGAMYKGIRGELFLGYTKNHLQKGATLVMNLCNW